eukprot:TRINITY_DN2997_c0_g1_i5.p1 TRINITY_DN2997_c0_g1~~TRINITY_DN2997_c0_g1_i5.p1  ORF type:complete len:678 (+),score=128.97 TRINITY_DN2997_c0_g1_i5:98-2131(+)
MSRPSFPGKPGRLKRGKKEILPTVALPLKVPVKAVGIERTRLFLTDFYATAGLSDEEDEELNGFSTREVERARHKVNNIDAEISSIREDLHSAIEFHFEERFKSVLPSKVTTKHRHSTPTSNNHQTSKQPQQSTSSSNNNKKRKLSFEAVKKIHNYSAASPTFPKPRTPSGRSNSSISSNCSRKSVDAKPSSSRRNSMLAAESPQQARKPRVQIQIPSWRRVETGRCMDWKALPGEIENLSDEAYLERHEKAEEEEQILWESWQTLRKSIGKSCRGRSKSRRWREVNINKNKLGVAESNPLLAAANHNSTTADSVHHERLNDDSPQITTAVKPVIAAGRRQRRVSSLQSEDSFSSGRLSPRTSSLQEILVATAPPTPIPEDNLPTTLPPVPPSAYSSPLAGGSTAGNTPRYSLNNEYYDSIDHQIENCYTTSPTKLPGDSNHANESATTSILQSLHNQHDDNLMPLSPPLSPTASVSPPPPTRKTRSSISGGRIHDSSTSQSLVFVDLPQSSTSTSSNSTENCHVNVDSTSNTTTSNSFCFSSSDLLLKTATTTNDVLTPTKRQLRHSDSDKGNLARTPPVNKNMASTPVKRNESPGHVVRKVAGAADKKNTLRSPKMTPGKKKSLPMTPKRRSEVIASMTDDLPTPTRDSYPLRSQSPSRRTRLGLQKSRVRRLTR